jgi:subtilase family serine protease
MTVRQTLARALGAVAVFTACAYAMAQAAPGGSVTLNGNHPPQAAALLRAAPANPAMPLDLTIVLALRNQAALEQLLADQQNPASAHYRKWLTPDAFARRFGPTDKQVDDVTDWLKHEGFAVTSVNRIGRTIRAHGDAATAERAFSTTLMSEGAQFANTTDPAIPAQFDRLIVTIMGLDNMHAAVPAGLHRSQPTDSSALSESETLALADVAGLGPASLAQMPGAEEGGSIAFGPIDVETFYDELPLLSGGNTGSPSPDCIALDEDSDYLPAAVTLYDSTFGLTPAPITNVYPDGGTPGINGDEVETLLDIDYSQATAPGTPLHPYIDGDLYGSISQSVTDGVCGAISISFIFCGEPSSFYTGLDMLFQEAVGQGQSVFIATGDWGAAGLEYSDGTCVDGTTRNVSEMAASLHVTAVGGTTFSPQYNESGIDSSVVGVAPDGIESGWNASGGGESGVFSKPAWQTGPGVPADGRRDLPDVSMIAWAPFVFIGADDSGTAIIQCCWGGTSLATPLWAGYSRVLAKASGKAGLGLLNPTIYGLANAGLAANGIEDVVSGNNNYNGVVGFTAGPGYDQVTGWGSVDMASFAGAFTNGPRATSTASASATATPSATATRTSTATATRSSTPTPTSTTKATSSATPTATISATATRSATATPTATATQTRTATPTATATSTSTLTSTPTATITSDPTQTATATASATPTSTATQTPTPVVTPVTSALEFTPAKLRFGKVDTGASSSVQTVTLSNPKKAKAVPITLERWSCAGDFSVYPELTTCTPGEALSPGQECVIALIFKPTSTGAASGTLTIQDNASNNQQIIVLKGTGK